MGEVDHRRLHAMDRISGLPDELLHSILVRLRSARAAARTSLLSRRWRRVWAELPEIFIGSDDAPPPASFVDVVDAAVAAFAAPAVERLEIAMPSDIRVSARGVATWLRFASQRLVGKLDLRVQCQDKPTLKYSRQDEEEEVVFPVFDRATRITLSLGQQFRSHLQPAAGSFTALTHLGIHQTSMEARALEALVSLQCPRLKILTLVIFLVAASDVSLHSGSLVSLFFYVNKTRRLEVVAPRMEELKISCDIESHSISAPKLAEVFFNNVRAVYSPCHNDQLVHTGRHLRLLEVGSGVSPSVLQMFDKVDELSLDVSVYRRQLRGRKNFTDETSKFPRCETLQILWSSYGMYFHGFAQTMLHLLRKCNGVRKFTVQYHHSGGSMGYRCPPSSCGCGLPRSMETRGIILKSLQEVEIEWCSGSFEEIKSFVEHLCKCSVTLLEKVIISCTSRRAPAPTKEEFEELNSMCSSHFIVEFNVINSSVR